MLGLDLQDLLAVGEALLEAAELEERRRAVGERGAVARQERDRLLVRGERARVVAVTEVRAAAVARVPAAHRGRLLLLRHRSGRRRRGRSAAR